MFEPLSVIGPDSTHFPKKNRKMLGDLFVALLYREFDVAVSILLKFNDQDKDSLMVAAKKLEGLCIICKSS